MVSDGLGIGTQKRFRPKKAAGARAAKRHIGGSSSDERRRRRASGAAAEIEVAGEGGETAGLPAADLAWGPLSSEEWP